MAGWVIYGTEWKQAFEWSREGLAEIGQAMADLGVTVVIEQNPADSNLLESADDGIEMMRAVGMTNVKLMFDTIHAMYRNEVPTDYVYRMGSDLKYVHISDIERLPPGQGRGDFIGLVQALTTSASTASCRWRSVSTTGTPSPTSSPARPTST